MNIEKLVIINSQINDEQLHALISENTKHVTLKTRITDETFNVLFSYRHYETLKLS